MAGHAGVQARQARDHAGAAAAADIRKLLRRESAGPNIRHIPERSCVACGKKFPKGDLVRVVKTPSGSVQIDESGKSAGRGAYFCHSAECWRRGITKGGIDRSLKISLSADQREQIFQESLALKWVRSD